MLELSDYTRKLTDSNDFENIKELIGYVLHNRLYEAFSWVTSTIQEAYEKEENQNKHNDFVFDIGKKIEDYDTFMSIIGAEDTLFQTASQTICDKNGEIDSFFNILIRKTKYNNIYLASAENFDTRDNDFIQYKLLFTDNIEKYIQRINDSNNNIPRRNDDELELWF